MSSRYLLRSHALDTSRLVCVMLLEGSKVHVNFLVRHLKSLEDPVPLERRLSREIYLEYTHPIFHKFVNCPVNFP